MGTTDWSHWGWLGDHLALDFANTVRVEDGRRVDLLNAPADLHRWLSVEPAPLPMVEAVSPTELADFRVVRDAALAVLHAAAAENTLPPGPVGVINDRVRHTGITRLLGSAPGAAVHEAADPATGVVAVVGVCAAAVVDLVAREDLANLAVCHAPGCGQFFHRGRPNQRWCSPGCGNRARVDRHRHRHHPPETALDRTRTPGPRSAGQGTSGG
ncbi:CGNR zinc finger domain-containing protein [Kocuria marina]|uniref:CGNR zinc finger domain-containing protein n=1 Tax=Kocuria marina TaxID=223184 RepID=UPI002989F23C|nr:CGNR zinc finger domain-containing protein [Kocuria marina]MCT1734853.1 CGNR zinc finger domain-containing protein [Kocuria marina]